ncbi:MAG: leucine-rich repeat domain-containing protein [Candidatus Diapherotrites archaeon]
MKCQVLIFVFIVIALLLSGCPSDGGNGGGSDLINVAPCEKGTTKCEGTNYLVCESSTEGWTVYGKVPGKCGVPDDGVGINDDSTPPEEEVICSNDDYNAVSAEIYNPFFVTIIPEWDKKISVVALDEDSDKKLDAASAAAIKEGGNSNSAYEGINDLDCLTYLDVKANMLHQGIGDLSIISGLKNLEIVFLGKPAGLDLSPLSDLPKLRVLELQMENMYPDYQTYSISQLSNLTTLESFKAEYAVIADLSPLSKNTNMKMLELKKNKITDILPLSGMTKMEYLDLSQNPFSDISPVSNMKSLKVLDILETQVKDLSPLSGLTELRSLSARGGSKESRDFSPLYSLSNLEYLFIGDDSQDICDDLQAKLPNLKTCIP